VALITHTPTLLQTTADLLASCCGSSKWECFRR
jgi:hypothetical protein